MAGMKRQEKLPKRDRASEIEGGGGDNIPSFESAGYSEKHFRICKTLELDSTLLFWL